MQRLSNFQVREQLERVNQQLTNLVDRYGNVPRQKAQRRGELEAERRRLLDLLIANRKVA